MIGNSALQNAEPNFWIELHEHRPQLVRDVHFLLCERHLDVGMSGATVDKCLL